MEYKLANRMKKAEPTLIRQVGDYAANKEDFIFFSIGNPSYETFPVQQLRELSDMVFEKYAKEALPYGENPGYPPLRKALSERLEKQGFPMERNQVFITPGSGHGIDLMTETFCEQEDFIITEEYTYAGIIGAARMMECQLVGVKMESDGMNMEELEKTIQSHPTAKFIYLVPTFSNPTGVTWSFEKRKRLYELACQYNLMIYEDNPYGELRFYGETIPSIKTLDVEDRVVYAGSFSKILSSGIRVGYIVCPNGLYDKISTAQGNVALSSNQSQMIVDGFLKQYDLDEHIERVCEFYEKKCAAMKSALDRYLPHSCNRTDPSGGLFIWVNIPENLDTMQIWHELLDAGVGVTPSAAFTPDGKDGHGFRLNYSHPSMAEIEKGCGIFGEVLKRHCD